jgi:hypothetical protein
MLQQRLLRRITVGEDKAYDTADHVAHLRAIKRQHHRNRQASSERHRRTHHAAPRLWHVAIVPGDDRMHLWLGQAARHDAQDQTSWPSQRRYRLHAQSDRLQSDPHSQTAGGVGQRPAHNILTAPKPQGKKDKQRTNLQVLQQTAR